MTKDQRCGTPDNCICGMCNVIDINRKENERAHVKNVENYEKLLEFAKRLP